MMIYKDKFIRTIEENQAIINKVCFGYACNAEDRLDLKQEILAQLWKAYPHFKGNSQISTWIYRVALNTAVSNYRRSKKKIPEWEINNELYQVSENEYSSSSDENIDKLYNLIYQLNELEKAIILLYLDDLSYKGIAEIIGITETNVATKINRIKLKLKNQLNNKK